MFGKVNLRANTIYYYAYFVNFPKNKKQKKLLPYLVDLNKAAALFEIFNFYF